MLFKILQPHMSQMKRMTRMAMIYEGKDNKKILKQEHVLWFSHFFFIFAG